MPGTLIRFGAYITWQGRALLLAAWVCLLAHATPASSGQEHVSGAHNLLALHSYHRGYAWQDSLDKALDQTLSQSQGVRVEVFHEYMDSLRLSDPALQIGFFDHLKQRYAGVRIDAIIATDNEALSFLFNYRDWLFGPVPVVFAGINGFRPEMYKAQNLYSGVTEKVDMLGTLRAAVMLRPQTQRVVVFGGHSMTYYANLQQLIEAAGKTGKGLEVRSYAGLRLPEVLEVVRRLDDRDMVLITEPVPDEEGKPLSFSESTKMITGACPVPAYSLWDVVLGKGVVGGSVASAQEQGRLGAEMALQVLRHRDHSLPPVIEQGANVLMFDYEQLMRFKMSLADLPGDSVVVNRPDSIWDRYKTALSVSAAVFLFMVLAIALLALNVLKRRRAERALQASEEKFRNIVEMANEGIWSMDREMRTTFVNRKMSEMLGYQAGEMIGRTVDSFMLPEDLQDHALKMEQRVDGQAGDYERRFRRKDGSVISTIVTATPLKDEQGRFAGSFGMLTDITARTIAEKALKESEEKLRGIFDTMNAGIILVDASGRIIFANPRMAEMFGYEMDQLIGSSYVEHTHGSESEEARRKMFQLIAGTIDHVFLERLYQRRDGATFWGQLSGRRLFHPDGSFWALLGVIQDITERKLAEQERADLETQLRQAQKMEALGTLAGGIAHDFNNILAAVLGYAELAREEAMAGKSNPQDLDQIIAAAGRAKDLVQKILTFGRKGESDLKPLNLSRTLRPTLEILSRTLPKMISIETSLAQDLRPVLADTNQMEQVVLNLASNAADAMPEGGRLTIATANVDLDQEYCSRHLEVRPGPYVELTFSDDGLGMDELTKAHIFDPFFTTKEVGKGTGLGLSTVYGIVKSHGGHIHCESELGRGATFHVYLPATEEQGAAGQPQTSPGYAPAVGEETILLVDDEEALRELGARALKSAGYTVLTAGSGEQALEVYLRHRAGIGLVITDLGMPGMGGGRLLQAIKEIDPTAKVLIASGYAADVQVKESLRAGAAGFVAKPFKRADLLNSVRALLDMA